MDLVGAEDEVGFDGLGTGVISSSTSSSTTPFSSSGYWAGAGRYLDLRGMSTFALLFGGAGAGAGAGAGVGGLAGLAGLADRGIGGGGSSSLSKISMTS